MASSGKKKKRKGISLEDQNSATIQCIVDAKVSIQSTYEGRQCNWLQSNVCPIMPTSTVYTQTFIATSSGGNCYEKKGYYPGQLMKDGSVVATSLKKEVRFRMEGLAFSM